MPVSSVIYRMRFGLEHRWTPGHMSAYLDGELASGARLRLERHIGECAQCRRVLAGLRGLLDALHELPAVPVGSDSVRLAASVQRQLGDLHTD